MPDFDHIIVGRGLAGMVLSEELARRGRRVLIFDQAKPNRATQVAAGSVNPISFKRVILSWRASSMLRTAQAFYSFLEQDYDCSLITDIPAQRIHASAEEADLWNKRMLEEPIGNYILPVEPETNISAPYGVSGISGCFWLKTKTLLKHHREKWLGRGALIEEELSGPPEADGDFICVKNHSARSVIYCTGSFDMIAGLVPVQGEVLTLRIPGLMLENSVHRSCFVIPLGKDTYRIGSTFEWKDVWSGPTTRGCQQILTRLKAMVDKPFQVIDHEAGTRPTTKDRRPLVGPRPGYKGQYILNGLGSRGVMLAPWCASHLSDQLCDGVTPDPEVDPARFV